MYSISFKDILSVVAEEQTRVNFEIEELSFVKSATNFETIRERSMSAHLDVLEFLIEVTKPFKDNQSKVDLPDKFVILIDTLGIDGEYINFYLHQSETVSNEDFIVSLTVEQRKRCYVINQGRLESFKVVKDAVIYGDIELELNPKLVTKVNEVNVLKKRVVKLQKELKELTEIVESMSK